MTGGAEPWEIASGTDGALWFTEYGNSGAVGRHVPGGTAVSYTHLTLPTTPYV